MATLVSLLLSTVALGNAHNLRYFICSRNEFVLASFQVSKLECSRRQILPRDSLPKNHLAVSTLLYLYAFAISRMENHHG